ncbi:uncharacterized protein DUF4132 [Kineococcus xinjiangensis]|uniref:Uncharacterized protein DUF4132 n=1 Tax=Kineococcus xinjiangensis TaxID=512762 RepID=A0A2S6IHW9_9ACTN|nr:DUF4132 domain-containing protein [Kineococcus xinjiangensis]PPK93785.1 uncharacterized protein DUF4132 [Kineococcus xinjiangensis]
MDLWLARDVVRRYERGGLRSAVRPQDVARLAEHLAHPHGRNGEEYRPWDPDVQARRLGALAEPVRDALAAELLAREDVRVDQLGWLLEHLAGDVPGQVVTAAVPGLLARAGRAWHLACGDELTALLRLAARTGTPVPAAVGATARRTVEESWSAPALTGALTELDFPLLNCGEPWADRALAELPGLGPGWQELVAHVLRATSARPSATWDRRGAALVAAVGEEAFRRHVCGWLELVGRPRTLEIDPAWGDLSLAVDPHNVTAVRGLLWLLSLLPADAATARTVARVVDVALRRVPGVGVRSAKLANAGVLALSRMDGEAALAQLARLSTRVTYRQTAKQVDAALEQRASALGLSRSEVEELGVPTYDLTEVGARRERLGDVDVELLVRGSSAVLTWRTTAGKAVKSVPAAVRRDHPEQLAELKAAAKDISAMLAAQAERLDRMFLEQRVWPHPTWRERYLDHPLVGTLARRLVWVVDGVPCAWADGALRDVDDAQVHPAAGAQVTLWHPVGRDVAEVLAWREWLARHGVVQPFKQAHREVYLLTDAERATGTYSNRFAAHVLRQHQFQALTGARGWASRLRLMVEDSYPPATRELARWGLRAEFWVEGAGGDAQEDVTEVGAYLRLVTDQVRFYPVNAPRNVHDGLGGGYEQWIGVEEDPVEPLPLAEVPALVLSEVLRDVDLFVGVASVGNDPTWQDGGPQGRYREYWHSFGFGELSATAATRRELLARLVPRLAIAERCTVQERFLHVRGDLRTYKIHLGSGNILMSPNDEYLCIVPKQAPGAGGDGMFLPFEGDRTLGVILSKAVLLANDTAITDRSITSQIRRGR